MPPPERRPSTVSHTLSAHGRRGAVRRLRARAPSSSAGKDVAHADCLARDALTSFAQHSERQGIAEALDTMAAVSATREDGERAATIAGAAAAIRETIAAQPAPFDVAIISPLLQQIKESVSGQRWHRSWDQGRALDRGSGGVRAGERCKVSTGLR
jgi:hypothetical protein